MKPHLITAERSPCWLGLPSPVGHQSSTTLERSLLNTPLPFRSAPPTIPAAGGGARAEGMAGRRGFRHPPEAVDPAPGRLWSLLHEGYPSFPGGATPPPGRVATSKFIPPPSGAAIRAGGGFREAGPVEHLGGRHVAQRPARTRVRAVLHRPHLRVGDRAEVRPLRQVLRHQPVGVPVQAPLPGVLGGGEMAGGPATPAWTANSFPLSAVIVWTAAACPASRRRPPARFSGQPSVAERIWTPCPPRRPPPRCGPCR